MARYKDYDYSQGKFIPIHFDRQILPGTFEYSLQWGGKGTLVLKQLNKFRGNKRITILFYHSFHGLIIVTPVC
jgi:hypothetical protein